MSNDELFTMLHGIDGGGEREMKSILNDSDNEFVGDKLISKIVDDTHDTLGPEANVHVASKQTKS